MSLRRRASATMTSEEFDSYPLANERWEPLLNEQQHTWVNEATARCNACGREVENERIRATKYANINAVWVDCERCI